MNTLTTEKQFPTFPRQAIQGLAKKFVDLYSPIREVPEAFLWLSFVTYYGNAISPYVRLAAIGEPSEPRFYGVVLGQSGRTRKSSGNTAARNLFKKVGQNWHSPQTFIEGIGSVEGVIVRLVTGGPAVLDLDELNLLAAKADITGSVGLAALHKLFEDHSYHHPLANGDRIVTNSYFSLLAASTLEDFQKAWKEKASDAGFFSRLFLVAADVPEQRIAIPREPDPADVDALVTSIRTCLQALQEHPLLLRIEPDAEAVWCAFYDSFGDGPEWNRIDTYGFRLMSVLAALNNETSVSKAVVQTAVEILQYEVAVRAAVPPIIANNPVAEMQQLILRWLKSRKRRLVRPVSKRDLMRGVHYERYGTEVFEKALSGLAAIEEVRLVPKGNKSLYTYAEDDDSSPESSPPRLGTHDELLRCVHSTAYKQSPANCPQSPPASPQ